MEGLDSSSRKSPGVVPEAFWLWADRRADGCWIWTGYIDSWGYGRFWVKARNTQLAYRIAYELVRGPIPYGLELDHLCRNKACVNPDHLEAVTHSVNMLRSYAARRGEAAFQSSGTGGHPLVQPDSPLVPEHF